MRCLWEATGILTCSSDKSDKSDEISGVHDVLAHDRDSDIVFQEENDIMESFANYGSCHPKSTAVPIPNDGSTNCRVACNNYARQNNCRELSGDPSQKIGNCDCTCAPPRSLKLPFGNKYNCKAACEEYGKNKHSKNNTFCKNAYTGDASIKKNIYDSEELSCKCTLASKYKYDPVPAPIGAPIAAPFPPAPK